VILKFVNISYKPFVGMSPDFHLAVGDKDEPTRSEVKLQGS